MSKTPEKQSGCLRGCLVEPFVVLQDIARKLWARKIALGSKVHTNLLVVFAIPLLIFSCCIATRLDDVGEDAPAAPPTVFITVVVSATPEPETPTPEPTATLTPTWTPKATATRTPTPTPTPDPNVGKVTSVTDGDTITVRIAGTSYKVRYIGMDCPELDQEMGQDARVANQLLVGGQQVRLERDQSETDDFGRLLRYVYLEDGTFVNAELIRQGLCIAKDYPPDTKYSADLHAVEAAALAAGIGRFAPIAIEPTATSRPPTAVPPTAAPATEVPPTPAPPTPVPPTAAPAGAKVVITAVDKREEFVDIKNTGDAPQNLAGWVLISEKGGQACGLGGVLEPGQTLRIWAMAEDAGMGGYNCGFGTNIWNNSEPDPAALYDAAGNLVSRY